MRTIVLDELATSSEPIALRDEEAASLIDSGLVDVRPAGGDLFTLLPRGTVGAVRIGALQIQVEPKGGVRLANLLFLLGYTEDPGFRPELVVGDEDLDLWPALAYSLAQSSERALALGVVQGYRTTDDALRTIRGRIRFGDQISRRPGQMVPIEVTFDDYSVDTAENRILLAALTRMLGVPGLNVGVRRRLLHLTARLDGVTRLPVGSPRQTWVPSRLNSRYHGALRLSEIVLRHAAAKPGPDGVEVASFVVTMWEVFENFVTVALKEALRQRPGSTQDQLGAYLAGHDDDWRGGDIRMAVDVVHLDAWGKPDIVFDAKYKVASVAGEYANADIYQMLAYCTALNVPAAWLVYAGGKTDRPQSHRVKRTGITVWRWPLDLSRAPTHVLTQIGRIAMAASG